jgi:hypothetical protein
MIESPRLRFSHRTVTAAFRARHEKYGGERAWDVEGHLRLFDLAKKAWAREDVGPEFRELYSTLKNSWQIFRPMKRPPSTAKVWRLLNQVQRGGQELSLSKLEDSNRPEVERAVAIAGRLKRTANGRSLMAASKFLHFWNPRLFIIVDREVMSKYVLQHTWIKNAIGACCGRPFEPDFEHYLDLLMWGAAVLRESPFVLDAFRRYVAEHVSDPSLRAVAADCEAAAVEWFLLGVVELPPG